MRLTNVMTAKGLQLGQRLFYEAAEARWDMENLAMPADSAVRLWVRRHRWENIACGHPSCAARHKKAALFAAL